MPSGQRERNGVAGPPGQPQTAPKKWFLVMTRNLLTTLTFTASLDFIGLYLREMFESAKKDLLVSKN